MELPSLQIKEFRALAAKSAQLGSYHELVKLVEAVFSNIEMLKLSFRESTQHKHHEPDMTVDVRGVEEFYRDFPKVTKNQNTILHSLDSLLGKLKGESEVKALLKNPQQLRGLFIALLYPRFYEFENTFQLIRLAHVLHYVPVEMRRTLSQWLCDVNSNELLLMVEAVQTVLSVELLKLLPDSGEEDRQAVKHYIMIYCRLLELFFRSNQLKKRIDYAAFQNAQLTQHFDPLAQVKLTMMKNTKLNFVGFPFLFDLDYKNKLLEFQSRIEQMMNIERSIQGLQSGMIPSPDAHGNYTIDSVLYLNFEIRRNHILDDSVVKISQTKHSLKKPLKIAFVGEEGHDQGGVKKQYFQLVTREVFNPNLGMFVHKNNSRYFWFNGDSLEAPIMFEFVGVLLGLSIYNSIQLDLHFPNVVYKKLLEDESTPKIDYWKELADVQPEVFKGIKTLLDSKQSLAGLDLYFQAETESFGVKKFHELKPGGSGIAVTHHNKHQYATLYAEWLLNKHIFQQFKSFKKGFYRVVTGSMIKVFFARELQKVICGQENLDFKAMEKSTEYEGYNKQSPIIKQLWEILHEMDIQQKKSFLFFVTGSDRAPIKGLGELGLLIQRQSPDTDNLPTAHTCTNVFLLPDYSSKAKLEEKLNLALQHNQGFGLI